MNLFMWTSPTQLKFAFNQEMVTQRVSEGLQTKQFQRHPSLTRRVTRGFEMRSGFSKRSHV
jgi:hypothetical protein